MEHRLISCIIPVFNGERYLGEAIDSILAQTYRPLEILVADDGSTDGTAGVAAAYGERVRYLRQANGGASAARNLGLNSAKGEFVAFLDADDLWHPEKLERQMARFEARPELQCCVSFLQNFWISELAEEAERYQGHHLSKPVPGYHSETLLARKSVFATVGPFNAQFRHADKTEWFLRCFEQGISMELLSDVLAYRRLHRTNASRTHGAASREEYLKLLKLSLDRRRFDKTAI